MLGTGFEIGDDVLAEPNHAHRFFEASFEETLLDLLVQFAAESLGCSSVLRGDEGERLRTRDLFEPAIVVDDIGAMEVRADWNSWRRIGCARHCC